MSLTNFQNKLEQKLGALSISLDAIRDQQNALLENADKVKSCINIAVETQVNSLRGRERQLIRQVEVVTAHQKSLLDSQIAKMMHLKGSLNATQEILQQCKLEDIEALSKIIEGNMSSFKPISPLNVISVQLDANPLTLAIGNFGKVHLPDTITHHQSAVIPDKMEDYGDSEHDVLHKSIGEFDSNVTSGNCSIKIEFPKIPTSGWLASPKQKNPPLASSPSEHKLGKDVSFWLADLRLSRNPEDNKMKPSFDIEDDYHFLEVPSKTSKKERSRTSSFGSSIEIVHCEDSEKDQDVCSLPENEISVIKTRWLNYGGTTPEKSTKAASLAIEEFACQANEPCKSYDDCLFDGCCKELAKERALQTTKWLVKTQMENKTPSQIGNDSDVSKPSSPSMRLLEKVDPFLQSGIKRKLCSMEGRDEFLDHMTKIMNSDTSRWLSQESRCKVLKAEVSNQRPGGVSITYKPPPKLWLSGQSEGGGGAENSEKGGVAPMIQSSPHSNIWLLHKHKEDVKTHKENESKIECSRRGNSEFSFTVSDLKGALSELAVLVPKFTATTTTTTTTPLNSTKTFDLSPFLTPNKTSQISHMPQNTHSLCQSLTHHQDTPGREFQRKLKWLSSSHSRSPVPGHVDIISRAPSFLPDSLVALAESNLDKWLINRL